MEEDRFAPLITPSILQHFDAIADGRIWEPLAFGSADELLYQLTALVDERLREPDSFLIVCTGSNRFVQVAVDEHGEIRAETVSNRYLEAHERLSFEQEAMLVSLGWLPPDDEHPNWWRDFGPAPWPATLVAALCGRTLLDVHLAAGGALRVNVGRFSRPFDQPVGR